MALLRLAYSVWTWGPRGGFRSVATYRTITAAVRAYQREDLELGQAVGAVALYRPSGRLLFGRSARGAALIVPRNRPRLDPPHPSLHPTPTVAA